MHEPVTFVCFGCGSRLKASLKFVGRRGDCPQCNGPVVVPARAPEEEPSMLILDEGHRIPSERTLDRWVQHAGRFR
jgi:DNA-directed RNA polymerase subunit RPC12/RpoP